MDSRVKLVAITCAGLVVATILGIVALLHVSQNSAPVSQTAGTREQDTQLSQMAAEKQSELYVKYQLDPDKDPYAFLNDKDFFDEPLKEDGSVAVKKGKQVSLLVSSVQKDIRVHVVGPDGNLLTGTAFEVVVSDKDGTALSFEEEGTLDGESDNAGERSGDEKTDADKESDREKPDEKQKSDGDSAQSDEKAGQKEKPVYIDEDEDGIIYIAGVSAGEYHISLEEREGYDVPDKATPISVSNDISYTAISDISFLIKSEDEIDATVEDSVVKEAEQDADGTESNVRLSEGASVFGIDVSKWNKTIDWKKVKEAGVEFAIIRCGYRGSVTGALVEDPYFKKNIEGALDAGVRVGIYFFTQAVTPVEAVEEASMVLTLCRDYKVAFPMFIDTEGAGGNGRADGLSAGDRTAVIKAFCETIENEGHTAGVYASKHWLEKKLDAEELRAYQTWLAQYSREATYEGDYGMWQYTSAGRIDGIQTLVDFNVSYMDY